MELKQDNLNKQEVFSLSNLIEKIPPEHSCFLLVYPNGDQFLALSNSAQNIPKLNEECPIQFFAFPFTKESKNWEGFEEFKCFPSTGLIIVASEGKINTWGSIPEELYSEGQPSKKTLTGKSIPSLTFTSNKSEEEWKKLVENSTLHMKSEKADFTKVVLAREVSTILPNDLDIVGVLKYFKEFYPNCLIFCLKTKDGKYFIGATPETLIDINESQGKTMALAGTMPRGKDDLEEMKNRGILLTDRKLMDEHQIVVDRIVGKLKEFSQNGTIQTGDREILTLLNVMHLETKITFVLKNGFNPEDVASVLHPTPALAGMPEENAEKYIADFEGINRGLYGGIIGSSYSSVTRFHVAIRCFTYNPNTMEVTIYVGAGIMPDSIANDELIETERKASACLNAIRLNLLES